MFKDRDDNKILTEPILLALCVLGLGWILRFFHLPFGRTLVVVAYIGIAIMYTLRFLDKEPKTNMDKIKWVFVLLFSLGGFFSLYYYFLLRLIWLIIIVAVIWYFINRSRNR